MSRTDKTRPRWVRIADTGVAVHDHRFGPCTLPDRVSADTTDAQRGECYWGSGGYHVLGCDGGSCSREWQLYRRQTNRRDRYRVRRELRAYREQG